MYLTIEKEEKAKNRNKLKPVPFLRRFYASKDKFNKSNNKQ